MPKPKLSFQSHSFFRRINMRGLCLFILISGINQARGQSDYLRNYSLSIGLTKQFGLINFNEQLLNDGFRPVEEIGSVVGFGYNQNLKNWRLQFDFNMFTNRNKTKDLETAVDVNCIQMTLAFGRDLIPNNQVDLVPQLGMGFGSSQLNFQAVDTASSYNTILNGYATSIMTRSKFTFYLNPRIQFNFRSKESALNEGYCFELGYIINPFRLKWTLPGVSLNQNKGFYFKVLIILPQLS